jgi:2-polyprenyl-3-methyl-5-hydroxy-6-metoxy-1,4-benzoquinol methylase
MAKTSVDPKKFWENKILEWETGRYEEKDKATHTTILEKIANRASNSLRNRIRLACETLQPIVAGKRVVEIGCGSGFLAEQLINAGAIHYTGFDISQKAIDEATRRHTKMISSGIVQFHAISIDDMPILSTDVVFSLGLLDWLTDDEIVTLFHKSGDALYLHAIAERTLSIQRLIHKAYVYLSYGHRTGSYVPRYFTALEIKSMANQSKPDDAFVYRNPKLSFGAFISNFAYPGAIII